MSRRIKVDDSQKTFFGCLGIILVACLCIGGCVGGCSVAQNFEYSSGFRDGTLVKLSHKGIFFKTYEGELATQGFAGKGNHESNLFEFTIWDEKLFRELEALPSGVPLRLHYSQKLWVPFWNGSTDHIIQSVEKK
jgi:hypothetical protein